MSSIKVMVGRYGIGVITLKKVKNTMKSYCLAQSKILKINPQRDSSVQLIEARQLFTTELAH